MYLGKILENFNMDYTFYITGVMLVFSCVMMLFLLRGRMSLFNIKCHLSTWNVVDIFTNQDADE